MIDLAFSTFVHPPAPPLNVPITFPASGVTCVFLTFASTPPDERGSRESGEASARTAESEVFCRVCLEAVEERGRGADAEDQREGRGWEEGRGGRDE